jgi:hypothetical protein
VQRDWAVTARTTKTGRWNFSIMQGGIEVVNVEGRYADAKREVDHYVAVYSQDGPVEVKETQIARYNPLRSAGCSKK